MPQNRQFGARESSQKEPGEGKCRAYICLPLPVCRVLVSFRCKIVEKDAVFCLTNYSLLQYLLCQIKNGRAKKYPITPLLGAFLSSKAQILVKFSL